MAIPAVVAKLIKRKPLIIDGDDLWQGGWANYHPWPVKKQLEFCESKLGFLADKITVVSEKMKQRFLEAGIKKQKIVKRFIYPLALPEDKLEQRLSHHSNSQKDLRYRDELTNS